MRAIERLKAKLSCGTVYVGEVTFVMHFAEGDVLTFGETGKDPRRELAELRCPSRSERARSSPLRVSVALRER